MILNEFVFGLMCIEALICLLLALPLGNRYYQSIVKSTSGILASNAILSYISNIVLALIFVLFLGNTHTTWKHKGSTEEGAMSDGMRIRLLAAQRDMYITGMSLFLFILLRMVYSTMEKCIRLEKSLEALEKQAKGANASFKSMMEEKKCVEDQFNKLKEVLGDSQDGEAVEKLLEENATLTRKNQESKKKIADLDVNMQNLVKQAESQAKAYTKMMDEKSELEKKAVDMDAMISQSKSQAKAYEALLSENKSLKNQLSDFDILMGDQVKKDK